MLVIFNLFNQYVILNHTIHDQPSVYNGLIFQ